jgi:hypothetical protein
MSVQSVDRCRRSVLCFALAALIGIPHLAHAQTLQQHADAAGLYFRDVRVDTSTLAARGVPNYALRVAQAMGASARRTFADRITRDRNAPILVLRIDSVELAMGGGNGALRHHRGGGDSDHDFVEGAGLIIAPGGRILKQQPLLTALPSNSAGAWYQPDTDDRRLEALGGQFSQWMRRQLGI